MSFRNLNDFARQPPFDRWITCLLLSCTQRFTWASTSVYVPFVGQNVTVALARTPDSGPSQFELRVDGKLLESATTDSASPKNITIPFVGDGAHTLVVTKISEAMFGEALLTGVYVDGNGCAAPSPTCTIQGVGLGRVLYKVSSFPGSSTGRRGFTDLAFAMRSVHAVNRYRVPIDPWAHLQCRIREGETGCST